MKIRMLPHAVDLLKLMLILLFVVGVFFGGGRGVGCFLGGVFGCLLLGFFHKQYLRERTLLM